MSDTEIFKKNRNWILLKLFKMSGTCLCVMDNRLLKRGMMRWGLKVSLPSPRLFYSSKQKCFALDNLYTEAVLLPPVL